MFSFPSANKEIILLNKMKEWKGEKSSQNEREKKSAYYLVFFSSHLGRNRCRPLNLNIIFLSFCAIICAVSVAEKKKTAPNRCGTNEMKKRKKDVFLLKRRKIIWFNSTSYCVCMHALCVRPFSFNTKCVEAK